MDDILATLVAGAEASQSDQACSAWIYVEASLTALFAAVGALSAAIRCFNSLHHGVD